VVERSPNTDAVQGGHFIDPETGAIVTPIQPSTTFARDRRLSTVGRHTYRRSGSPAFEPVETIAARLDGGAEARVFASGLAACSAVLETVPPGGHVVAPAVMYHGAQDRMRRLHERTDMGLTLFDPTDPSALADAIRPARTDIVWIETPLNPTWDIIDIAAAAGAAHAAGAILVVDSTVAPVTTRPIEHGADMVFHAGTKYYGGHSDVMAGLLVTAEADERWGEIDDLRTHAGGVISPFDAWLLLRGMRTLHLRVERAAENAIAIARHFENHPALAQLMYPGLESHPGHETAKRQMDRGFGAMISMRVAGGREAAQTVVGSTEVFVRATSLGSVESLIEHRVLSEGPNTIVPDDLIRLSIGIEPVDELIADLEQALAPLPLP
jgi:cystathionine gamma-synthase